jgi:16S rRNA (guanine527-N7)-methyltransferase
VELNDAQLARFATYLDLLLKWNARIKLTSVTAPREVLAKHFLDSLAIVPALGPAQTLVDVGAGAGFPGVPALIAREALRLTCVESIQKKAAFLEALKRELQLPRLEVFAGRMESVVEQGRRFEAAVSRATFEPAEWISRGSGLVATGGRLIAMVVPGPETTLERLAPSWRQDFEEAVLTEPYAAGRALLILRGRRGPSAP